MYKSNIVKNRLQIATMMLLAGLFLWCAPAQAEKIKSEIEVKLQELDRVVKAKGYSFKVGYSRAMEKNIHQLSGLVKPENWQLSAPFERMETYLTATPSSYDWRDPTLGGNTPIRDQKTCGACWAFATVGPLEIAISRMCARTENLSEQYLLSCNEWGYTCGGGWFIHDYHMFEVPFTEMETQAGAVMETALPYGASDTVPCNGPHAHPYKLDNWGYVAAITLPTPAAIKQAIQTYGPVAASVCTGPLFQAYKSGIFDANELCTDDVNHAVTLVGWNDDLGTDNGYWILKNSWGPTWGEGGYMRIRYGKSMVGYAANYIQFSHCATGLPPALDCGHGPTIALGQTYTGLTNADGHANVATYGCTTSAENAPEKVYQVTTTTTGNLTVALTNQTTNLDVFILSDCDPTACKAFGTNQATYSNAPAGAYCLVVDGANANTIGTYDLTATTSAPPPPPPTLNCSSAVTLKLGTGYKGKTLATDPKNVSNYSCTSRTETGQEKVHKITTTATGDLTATLSGMTTDLDVFILSSCDPNSCLAFGDTKAVYPNAPAGTYYIVVDGNNGAYGSYTLTPTLVLPPPPAPDLTAAWTPTTLTSSNGGKTVTGTLKVSNIGNANAGAFTVAYYYSTNGVKLGSSITTQSVTGVAAGQSITLSPTITYTKSLIGKYVIAKVDSAGKVAEKNETNNTASSAMIQ